MNGGFLVDNIANLVTPTCAYADPLFPAANLVDEIPSVAYRSIGGNSLPRWNFGSAKTVTAFSMHNHNIPNDATIKLQFSSNNWLSVAEEVTLDWAAEHLYKVFAAKTYQYQGLSVVSSNPYVEIGEIAWCTAWEFARNYQWEYRDIKKVYKDVRVNKGHTFVTIDSVQRGYSLNFTAQSKAEKLKFEALLEQKKVVFILNFDENVPAFGTVEDDQIDSTVKFAGNEFSLRFWADTKGAA